MCGATPGGRSLEGIDPSQVTVIQGTVQREGEPVAGAYVRLLDEHQEFTAEVQTSQAGAFRFFAAPGSWSVRALAGRGAVGETQVSAVLGINEVNVQVCSTAGA